ncbi:MAG: hypothetical protein KDB26_04735 [Microthrixaceae bacterium]|nr:hypothetical protein [Microthrixaceae bacterium]
MGDVLQADLFLGIAGGAGGLVLGLKYPERLTGAVSIVAGVVGVVIGAVIAGVAIQSAFLDQSFLRKLRAIGRNPVDYLTPFLFTAAIGVFALLGLLVLAVLPATAPTWALATLGAWVGFFAFWSVASLLPGMGTLVQFVGLRQDAIDVPDDVDIKPGRREAR